MKNYSFTRLVNVDTIIYLILKNKIYKLVRISDAKTQILDITKANTKNNYKDLKWDTYLKLKRFNTIDDAREEMTIINETAYDGEWYDINGYYKCLSQ